MENITGCKLLDIYNTRMSLESFKAMCLARRKKNRANSYTQTGTGCVYPDCAGCEAGKKVMRGAVPDEIRERLGGEMAFTRKMGNCKNCEREMVLNTCGYCGSCGRAVIGLTGEAKERALAIAREKYLGKGRMKNGREKRGTRGKGRGRENFGPGEIVVPEEGLPNFLQGIDLEKYRVVVILAR